MKKYPQSKFLNILKTGQKLRFSIVVFCLLLCITSCSYSKKDPLGYRSQSFSATVSVHIEKTDFDAVLHISPPDGEENIDFKVDFISPKSLEGLSFVQSRDNFKILLSGKEYLSEKSELFSELNIGTVVKALSPTEPIRSIKSEDGYTLVAAGDCVIYIDPTTSLPIKAVCESKNLTVVVREFSFD